MTTFFSYFVVVVSLYLLCIVVIGVLGLRRTHTEDDFLTASRSIGPWVGGAVLAATQISAGTLVGTVGRHYATGVSWVWVWPGVWCGWVISAVFVGPKLREFGALTIPDFLAARFKSEAARALAAVAIILGYMILLVAQYQACGVIFQAIFGVKPIYAMMVLILSTLLYTILGGVRSSSYIDFLQIAIVVSGLLLAVPVLAYYVGGIGVAGQYLGSIDPRLTGWWYNWKQIFGFSMAFGFAIAAAPYEMVRFYSMRDKGTVRYAIGVCFLFQAIIGSCVLLIGLLTRAIFPNLHSADQASSMMAFNILPPLVGSLFVVALLSAIMSNVNSILLVASAGLSHDIYGKMINPGAPDRHKLFLNRLSIVLLSFVPVWFALRRYGDVQSIVVVETRVLASFFFVPIILGLNSKRGNSAGVVSAMLGGLLACLLWSFWSYGRATNIDAVEVGIAVSCVLFFGVSALTGGSNRRRNGQSLALKSLLVALPLSLTATAVCATASPQVSGYKCEISIMDEHKVAVAATVAVDGAPLDVAVLRYPSQNITDLRVTDREKGPIQALVSAAPGALIVKIPKGEARDLAASTQSSFTITYVVQDQGETIIRIPTPVPQARPPSAGNSIYLGLELPPGSAPVRDSFPSLNWRERTRGDAALTSIPSIVIAHWKDSHAVGTADRVLSTATLTNVGMVMILAAGSVVWWFASGRAMANSKRRRLNPQEPQN